jgi:large subunit ribosomal protein LX
MKAYEIKGQFRISVRKWQPFSMEVASADEAAAVEKIMSLIGSRHRVKRQFVKIEEINSVKTEDLKDHRVKHLLEASG